MKKETIVPQQIMSDKANYTGKYGMGFLVIESKTGEVAACVPTLEQAECALAAAQEKCCCTKYEIVDAGYTDSLYHKADSPFRFKPI